FHEWLGRTPALGPMWQAWERGDRKAAVAAIPAALLDELLLRGSPERMRARVREYLDAGIDTAFLALHSSEADPGRRRAVLRAALRALGPGGA
ncbi:MAG TPA: LLM class F420-dependent oxidoreductase, partial [Methylomirabilota bacterium]|nr:LLM class F420-dependent oxidoreductase [Methylomirabilota bacterium]